MPNTVEYVLPESFRPIKEVRVDTTNSAHAVLRLDRNAGRETGKTTVRITSNDYTWRKDGVQQLIDALNLILPQIAE